MKRCVGSVVVKRHIILSARFEVAARTRNMAIHNPPSVFIIFHVARERIARLPKTPNVDAVPEYRRVSEFYSSLSCATESDEMRKERERELSDIEPTAI